MKNQSLLILAGMPFDAAFTLIEKFKEKPFVLFIGRTKPNSLQKTKIDKFIQFDLSNPPLNFINNLNKLDDSFISVKFVFYASHQIGRKKLIDQSVDEIYNQLNVGLTSCIFLTKAILEKYSKIPGSIVFLGSEAGRFGGKNISIYAALKGALSSLVMGLAREIGPEGKRINLVSPSIINTKTLSKFFNEEDLLNMQKTIPLGRIGQVSDLVSLIYWLLSDESNFISGACIPITGGR